MLKKALVIERLSVPLSAKDKSFLYFADLSIITIHRLYSKLKAHVTDTRII
jgi:hypothetical protein